MCSFRLIVLKFGGSVLRTESDLARVVHEIYRWRCDGWCVVTVVSALFGRTDELFYECASCVDDPSPCATAAHVATGELHAASLLGLALDRAGIAATVQHPAAIRLLAEGEPLDARVVSVDQNAVHHALNQSGVVVLPGFIAVDHHAQTVVLGRGGSDLTAIFLAQQLKAQLCRLIKDVDGLYQYDPNTPGPAPRRFDHATWDDALTTDGSIVQHKAVHIAREVQFPFELGQFNDDNPSRVGSRTTVLATPQRKRQLRIALLGLGTVGSGVWQHLQNLRHDYDVCAIACQHVNKRRPVAIPRSILTDDAIRAATSGADVVIELIGGTAIARHCVDAALDCGAHVITANKALLAAHGAQIHEAAVKRSVQLRYGAAVGGSMPICEAVALREDQVVSVRAVLNGTCNFLLECGAAGQSLDDAIKGAQRRGLCERDPQRDLTGQDAVDKLCVLAQLMGWGHDDPERVECDAITATEMSRAQSLAAEGLRLRQVSTLCNSSEGIHVNVELKALDFDDPLFDVPSIWNKAVIQRASGITHVVQGRGAGRWPTAEAVIADLATIRRNLPWWDVHENAQISNDSGLAVRRQLSYKP